MMRRVVVTGIGVIAAPGSTRDAFWQAISRGETAIRPMQFIPQGTFRFQNGAEVSEYRAEAYFDGKQADLLDRCAQFALIAAREAIRDAGLNYGSDMDAQTAIITGCSAGGQTTTDEANRSFYGPENGHMHPLSIPRMMINAGTSAIAQEFKIVGPAYTIATACSAANHAIGQAFWMVRTGQVESAITGGCEAPFARGFLAAWDALRVVSPGTCRPFSRGRKGLIFGEGAAMFVLEPLEKARARGAHVWGEVVGFGMSADAYHVTKPEPGGAVRAMRATLTDARIQPNQIGYVNAHGTGTLTNDAVEVSALREVFGSHAENLLVSSTKSIHGHALGAAGALEAAATLMALACGLIPPTANFIGPDPACDLDVVPNTARKIQLEWALSNSFAFGGLNAVLAFRKI